MTIFSTASGQAWGMRVAEARHLAEELRRKRGDESPCNRNAVNAPEGDGLARAYRSRSVGFGRCSHFMRGKCSTCHSSERRLM